MKPNILTFDEASHTYKLDGIPLPSVTTIIGKVIEKSYYGATEWHMQRGTAMHKCAEMIAKGIEFEHDPQIDGQVKALRSFFRDMKPKVYMTETMVSSRMYQYAGTLDLLAEIDGRKMIVDYKSTIDDDLCGIQCAAYGMTDELKAVGIKHAIGVHIKDDGTYKITTPYDLKKYGREFLAIRTVYAIKQRMGTLTKKGE